MNEFLFLFGPFCLVPSRREILAGGKQHSIPPKVFEALVYLIRHRDRPVSRDELMGAIWGRADLSGNQLTQLMRRVRDLIEDHDQRSIQTLHEIGYRWVRPIRVWPCPPSAEEEP